MPSEMAWVLLFWVGIGSIVVFTSRSLGFEVYGCKVLCFKVLWVPCFMGFSCIESGNLTCLYVKSMPSTYAHQSHYRRGNMQYDE